MKRNQYILNAVTAGLALGCLSDAGSSNREYASPTTAFVPMENCGYPVGYELENGFMEAGPAGGA